MIPGISSIKPNEKGNDEDEEPEELTDSWLKLLDVGDDETLSLKPWKEVIVMKDNKINAALALRAVIRYTQGEYILFHYYFPYLTLIT